MFAGFDDTENYQIFIGDEKLIILNWQHRCASTARVGFSSPVAVTVCNERMQFPFFLHFFDDKMWSLG